MKQKKLIWDVEDLDRINLPANDCRRFNGGYICPEPLIKTPKSRRQTPVGDKSEVIFFDRLRQ